MKRPISYWSSLLFMALLAGTVRGQETNTLSARELIQRGQDQLASNRWGAAENSFHQATESEPTNSRAYALWGFTLAGMNRQTEAIGAYEKAVELDPQRTNVWLHLGELYNLRGKLVRAAEAYEQYVSLNPENDKAYYWLYHSLAGLRRYGEAEKACRRALALNPTNAVYYVALGYCLENLGRDQEADTVLKKAAALEPQDPYPYLWMGISLYHRKNYLEAINALQKSLSLRPTSGDGNYWLGRGFAALDRYDEAAKAFGDDIKVDPEDLQAYEWRGVSLLRLGRFDEAAANFEEALQSRGTDPTIRRSLFCCYLLSSQYEKAYRLYPILFTVGGSALLLSYLAGLITLLRSSFRISAEPAPRFGFSLAWLVVFFQGQVALIFCLALLSWVRISENLLFAITLSGIPVMVAAAHGFARQPWGQPFSWPLRFGTGKVMALSLVGLTLALVSASWIAHGIERLFHWPPTVQQAIPLVKYALKANPVAAFSAIVLVAPIVEEILFRGLIYGALEKRLRVTGAIVFSSLLFALVHLQVVYFIPIFCLGVILGWARSKTRSLGLPILIHTLNNGVALIVMKFFEK